MERGTCLMFPNYTKYLNTLSQARAYISYHNIICIQFIRYIHYARFPQRFCENISKLIFSRVIHVSNLT